MYGDSNNNAEFQLSSLATKSHKALQTLEYNCNKGRSAHRLIGHNGVEISVQESSQSSLQTVNVEHNCEVHATEISWCVCACWLHNLNNSWL